MIVAGIDEAGYGPMLGPLVVSVSVFRVSDAKALPDLWHLLKHAVSREPNNQNNQNDHLVSVCDSKRLFRQRKGLTRLEDGLLPFLLLNGASLPRDFHSLLRRLVAGKPAERASYLEQYPWYQSASLKLPRDTYRNFVRRRAEKLQAAMAGARVDLTGLSAYPMEVVEFNRLIRTRGNKSEVSFTVIGSFLRWLWQRFPDEPVEAVVDRQGGRVRYGPLLFEMIRPRSLRIEEQSATRSVYRLTRGPARDERRQQHGADATFRVHFVTESEDRFLPVALASMLSKYLRELHMDLFNAYWRRHEESIKPTAGYVVDARRFLKDIAPLRQRLRIADELLIRRR